MSDVVCNNCGAPIAGEPPSGDPAQRKPCPNCGSTARHFSVTATLQVAVGGSATATVITYPEALLSTARSLIDGGEFSIGVVVAHMACEIGTERALSRLFTGKGLGALEEAVQDLLPGFNLANERVRNLYNALTGGEVQKQPFWQAFKDSASRRNGIVHRGLIVNRADAEVSYKAACDVVLYLK